VPGDDNAEVATDVAILQPSVVGWYINGQPIVFCGLPGEVPHRNARVVEFN